MTISSCPMCGSDGLEEVGHTTGYVADSSYPVCECSQCTSQTVRATVPDGLYEAIYQNRFVLDGYRRYEAYAKYVRQWRKPLRALAHCEAIYYGVAHWLAHEEHLDRERLRILDFGSGLGYLTAALRRAGHEAFGVDISEEAVAAASRMFGPWYSVLGANEESDSKRTDSTDIVLALEVIEHVESPHQFLDSIVQLLPIDGSLILSTPSRDFFGRDSVWATDLPPVHLHWISKEGLRCLASRLNLSIDFVDFREYNRNVWGTSFLRSHTTSTQHPRLNDDYSPTYAARNLREQLLYSTRYAPILFSSARFLRRPHNADLSEGSAIVAKMTRTPVR